ncbi:MAG: ComEA family DNA-binding protein [Myxococcaceae bacterium]
MLSRTAALAVVLSGAGAVGGAAAWRWPSSEPALPCAPEQVRWVDNVATCQPGPSAPLPTRQALTLGLKRDLNQAQVEDLVLVPGVGRALAREIVEGRGAGFTSWEEVDRVTGIGPAKLAALQKAFELLRDGGR